MPAENSHSYQLTTPQRGYIYISKSDPRNTILGIAKLEARYGKGNVKVVEDSLLLQMEGSIGVLEQFTKESNTPIVLIGDGSLGSLASTSQVIALDPPTNLLVLNAIPKVDATGNVSMDITVSFNDVPGASSYETIVSQTTPSSGLQAASITNVTSGIGLITVTWAIIANASNYVLTAQSGSNIYSAAAPFDSTVTTGSINVPTGQTYTVYVTPYNSMGIAGPAGVQNSVIA